MQELCNPLISDNGTLTEDSPLAKWGRLIVEASAKLKQNSNNPTSYASWMEDAGFINIQTVVHKWPTNQWPDSEEAKLKGLWNLYNLLSRLHEFTRVLFVKVLGWDLSNVDALIDEVKAELQNEKVNAYWPV